MKVVRTILFLLVVSFFLIGDGNISSAQGEFVDECLEQPELCEDSLTPSTDKDRQPELLQEEKSNSLFFELVRLFFALLLVIGLIYAFIYFLKKKNKFGNRIESLENIGGISVGQNKSIQLVRLGNRLYMVGVGENITLIDEIKDEHMIKEIMREKEEQIDEMNVGHLMQSVFKKKEDRTEKPFNHLFKEELKQLEKNRKTIIDRNKEDQDE